MVGVADLTLLADDGVHVLALLTLVFVLVCTLVLAYLAKVLADLGVHATGLGATVVLVAATLAVEATVLVTCLAQTGFYHCYLDPWVVVLVVALGCTAPELNYLLGTYFLG